MASWFIQGSFWEKDEKLSDGRSIYQLYILLKL